MTKVNDVITFIETKVQGKLAVFTAGNIDTSNCPGNLHPYHVAFDDETMQYDLIGKNISDNYIGTLFAVEELVLNHKDRYMLKENVDFVFNEEQGFVSMNDFLGRTQGGLNE